MTFHAIGQNNAHNMEKSDNKPFSCSMDIGHTGTSINIEGFLFVKLAGLRRNSAILGLVKR
ncbi:MAG TPA: hypothetical protein VN426_14825 [Syntrophomonadaceae bacterium]|nr:hypothetical protein [Syntrophomonadaceae bacterium]